MKYLRFYFLLTSNNHIKVSNHFGAKLEQSHELCFAVRTSFQESRIKSMNIDYFLTDWFSVFNCFILDFHIIKLYVSCVVLKMNFQMPLM